MAEKDFTLTSQELNKYFEYKDGDLYWKVTNSNVAKAGSKAGCTQKNGYRILMLNKKFYYIHRLVFMMHNNFLPKYIDHIDRNPSNNAIENLREVNCSQNLHNRVAQKNSKSGIKGVYWLKSRKKWVARCKIGKTISKCSYFDTMEEAKEAIEKFRHMHLGEFTTH